MTRILFIAGFYLCTWLPLNAAPLTKDNDAWNVNRNTQSSDPTQYYGEWKNHKYFPSPDDWRSVAIYQFVTDRLRDGNPVNNEGRYGGYDLYDVGKRHGGDFRGVRDALPYIKSLGYDGIWLSPIFQNRSNSYHGYAQIDFTVLDDRFGTLEDLRDLTSKAHELGMYVIVDIVVNHMDNLYYFEGHENSSAPFRMHTGEYRLLPRNAEETYADFKVDNTFHGDGRYSDVYDYTGHARRDDFGSGSYWFSDFHHNGDLQNYDDPWQNHLGKIYGIMDDLRTTHPRVQDKIIAMTRSLISSADIDGIRLDTPMQVPLYFLKRWAPAVKDHARHLGKNNFFIFGEFYCPRERSATMVGRGKSPEHYSQPHSFIDDVYTMNGGINYDFYFKFILPALKYQKGGVANAKIELDQDRKAYDFYDPSARETRYQMLNFFNNHDQWRLNWEEDGFRKSMLGSALIAFWPGMPLFYYGDEQGFSSQGTALDGWSREDFMTSKAWFKVASRQEVNPAVYDNFNMTHPHYLAVQKIMNVRKQYFALRNTDEIYERWTQDKNSNGIFAFSRIWGDTKNWAFVAFNNWKFRLDAGGSQGDLLTGWQEGDVIVNALNPSETYTLGARGKIGNLSLDGYETKVFVRRDNLQALNPTVQKITPAHDHVVAQGTQNIELFFSETMTEESLRETIQYDGTPVAAQHLSISEPSPGTTLVSFTVQARPGIHHVKVLEGARSKAGKKLLGEFRSRFRVGTNGDQNPLIALQYEPLRTAGLVKTFEAKEERGTFTLSHRAHGAKGLRISLDAGRHWYPWQAYSTETTHQVKQILNRENLEKNLVVQYYADGSAAYFARHETR